MGQTPNVSSQTRNGPQRRTIQKNVKFSTTALTECFSHYISLKGNN